MLVTSSEMTNLTPFESYRLLSLGLVNLTSDTYENYIYVSLINSNLKEKYKKIEEKLKKIKL